MPMFKYEGPIEASKSLMNRALIIQSFNSQIKVVGTAQCDDVVKMRQALQKLTQFLNIQILKSQVATNLKTDSNQVVLDAGEAGTVLRFLAIRVSKEKGEYLIKGSSRLLSRPQNELIQILKQLSVQCEFKGEGLWIKSQGWKLPQKLFISCKDSSQFATAVFLSCWGLEQDLEIELSKEFVSESYFEMTLKMLAHSGLIVHRYGPNFKIKQNQNPNNNIILVEPDMSSVFPIAVMAALAGECHIVDFPAVSAQPDFEFIKILQQAGCHILYQNDRLIVDRKNFSSYVPIGCDLINQPDLFPVLAIFCSFINGKSTLRGAPHLQHKESDRLRKTVELLQLINVKTRIYDDGIEIWGNPQLLNSQPAQTFTYDTDHDHRLAMAAGLIKKVGFPIQIINPQVVSKSFPNFWQILDLSV